MGERILKMLRDTVRAYREKDLYLAVEICRSDDAIDARRTDFLREIVRSMKDDSKTSGSLLHTGSTSA